MELTRDKVRGIEARAGKVADSIWRSAAGSRQILMRSCGALSAGGQSTALLLTWCAIGQRIAEEGDSEKVLALVRDWPRARRYEGELAAIIDGCR